MPAAHAPPILEGGDTHADRRAEDERDAKHEQYDRIERGEGRRRRHGGRDKPKRKGKHCRR